MTETTTPAPAKKKRRFGCLSILLTLAALALLAAAVAFYLARSAPEQWTKVNTMLDGLSAEQKRQRADAIETLFISGTGLESKDDLDIKPDIDLEQERNRVFEKTIVLPVDDANIWLATKLEDYLEQQNAQLPPGLSQPRVWIENGDLVLSARAAFEGIDGVINLSLAGQMMDDGKLRLRVTRLRSGKLPLPRGVIVDRIRAGAGDPHNEVVRHILDAFKETVIDPAWTAPADETRQVRVTGFDIHPDRVELRIRNSPNVE